MKNKAPEGLIFFVHGVDIPAGSRYTESEVLTMIRS